MQAANVATRKAPPLSVWGQIQGFAATWGRLLVSAVAIVAQLAALALFVVGLLRATGVALVVVAALTLGVLVWLLNRRMPVSYKLAWAVVVLILPVVGPTFFALFGADALTRGQRSRLTAVTTRMQRELERPGSVDLDQLPAAARRQGHYLETSAHQSPTTARVAYFGTGETGFEEILAGIRTAQRYVFCAYFMVAGGGMFERLFEALAERAAAGCDVRILYDDFGSVLRRPHRLAGRCAEAGIRVQAVNPLGLFPTLRYNNRDHRKICVVDGRVAFTGGINIGDEYVNLTSDFGYWKDNVIRLEGSAAWPFTVMFATQWELSHKEPVDLDALRPDPFPDDWAAGLAVPFHDSPFDDVHVALSLYRSAVTGARRSVDIVTPYLVIGDFLIEALVTTAASGVRVRILVPSIGDSRLVQEVNRACYADLVPYGVEVYEYQPGFVHSKVLLADDDIGIVGTVNLDYRSFYLHHECGVWLFGSPGIAEARADVDAIIASSKRVTQAEIDSVGWATRLVRAVLRPFSALM